MRFGIQFHALPTAPETVVYAKRALSQYPFEKVWVPDHLTHEHALVTLAAIIAQTQAHVGTSVTHPLPDPCRSGFRVCGALPFGRTGNYGGYRRRLFHFGHDSQAGSGEDAARDDFLFERNVRWPKGKTG